MPKRRAMSGTGVSVSLYNLVNSSSCSSESLRKGDLRRPGDEDGVPSLALEVSVDSVT